jgi:BlaI family transcriptional regulator, penicillinase repressor
VRMSKCKTDRADDFPISIYYRQGLLYYILRFLYETKPEEEKLTPFHATVSCSSIAVIGRRYMKKARLSKAETRVLEQFWKMGTCSVREILESLPEDERVAYTTVQTLVYRLEEKAAVRKVKKIGNAQLFEPAVNQSEFRSGLVGDLLDLFGGSPRLLVSNLLETGTLTLKDLKALQSAAPTSKKSRRLGGKGHA